MACIITNGNVGLSTANGFNLVESQNNPGQGAILVLYAERLANLVFTSASANAVGVVLYFYFSEGGAIAPAASTYYDSLIELQQNTSYPSGNNWVTRASRQLTAAEITNNVNNLSSSCWVVPVTFTTPYAIDNAGLSGGYYKWRLRVSRAGTGTNSPSVRTSNGTAISYHVWTDVQRTFADNDQVIKKSGDILTIDQTATIQGTLGTGETQYAAAFVLCKSANPACGSNQEMVWSPNSAKTLTIDGTVMFGAHSCFNVGVPVTFTATIANGATSATLSNNWAFSTGSYQIHFSDNQIRTVTLTNGSAAVSWTSGLSGGVASWGNVAIPKANMATVYFPPSTNGIYCGFKYIVGAYTTGRKASFYFYGERPEYERTTLAATVKALVVAISTTTDEVTWTNHGFSDGQPVYFTGTTLPGGINSAQIYYARPTDSSNPTNTFFLYDTQANALAGGATGKVDLTGSYSGMVGNTAIETTDITGWSAGDSIFVGGDATGSTDTCNILRTIGQISGTLMTVTPAIVSTRNRLIGHPIVRMNGYGVKIFGNATKVPYMGFVSPSNVVMDGVEKDSCAAIYQGTAGSTTIPNMPWDDVANTSKHFFTHMSTWRSVAALNGGALLSTVEAPLNGLEISYVNGGNLAQLFATGAVAMAASQKSGICVVRNNWMTASSGSVIGMSLIGMAIFSCVFEDNIFEGYSNPSVYGAWISLYGSNFVLNRNKFFGNYSIGGALKLTTALNVSGYGNEFNANAIGVLFDLGAEANCQLTDSKFGQEIANTYDFAAVEGALIGYQENSPTGAVTVDPTNFPACPAGSILKIRDYNDTSGDIRSWHPEGYFVSSSGKLSGKTYSGASALQSAWKCISDAIAGQSCAVLVTAQIANAAYYAGTYTLPSISAAYDGDQTASDTAAANTSEQTLLADFSPADNGAAIIVTLSQQTDAAEANSGVAWSALTFRQRRYGKAENSYTKTIVEVTGDVVFNWAVLPDNLFITESTAATVAAYTGITIDHVNQIVTIDEAHTLAELYDYTQYDLSQHIDREQWFNTIDGTTYSCSYDIEIDGVLLSGSGKKINMPSNELTLLNSGSCSALVTDINGTLSSISFTGLVAGSEVRLFKVSDDSEISGGAESSGTSHTFNFTHTVDVPVYAVILSLGYENIWTGDLALTNSPQSIPVSQRRDRVYGNP